MARKIVHTKSGTFYNGPTGRRKVSDPSGAFLSVFRGMSKSSSTPKGKSSTSYNSAFSSGYSGNYDASNPIRSKAANMFWGFVFLLMGIALLLLLLFKGALNIVVLLSGVFLIAASILFFTAKSTDDVEEG